MRPGLPSEVDPVRARQPDLATRTLRWRAQAGYARAGGGAFIRTQSRESYISGARAFGLLRWLETQLRGQRTLDEITRHLPAEEARTVSELVAHLVGIGAVDDPEAGFAAGVPPQPGSLEHAPGALPARGRGQLLAAL